MTKLELVAQICIGLENGSISIGDAQKLLPVVVSEEAVTAVYPNWVKKHLLENIESLTSTGITNPQLWLHDKQRAGENVTGTEIFSVLLTDQKKYQPQKNDMILKCVSLADIQFYEKYPHLIPFDWKGKLVYAWKSVVLNDNGFRCVPYLDCGVDEPFVNWYNLVFDWDDYEPAGLSAS